VDIQAARLWCILWVAGQHRAVQSPRRPDAKIPGTGGAQKFMKRPARHGYSFRKAGQEFENECERTVNGPA
jgi:hypothetical protein